MDNFGYEKITPSKEQVEKLNFLSKQTQGNEHIYAEVIVKTPKTYAHLHKPQVPPKPRK